jgi:uncharacterized phosphosugar-binding protein
MSLRLAYPAVARSVVERVLETQLPAIEAAARLVADAYRADGILQAYGTGHSRIVTLELSARAGGLAPVGMLAIKDLVMFGGTEPGAILDPTYERQPGLARRVYDLADPRPQDAFVIVSNSGINSSVVEMAVLLKERGHPLVAITSAAHTAAVASRDTSGHRLRDLADVVIDNCAPPGDAAVQLDDRHAIGAVSSLTGVLIAQLLTEAVCRLLMADGRQPPVFVSANLPEGDDHNAPLIAALHGRVRPIEP